MSRGKELRQHCDAAAKSARPLVRFSLCSSILLGLMVLFLVMSAMAQNRLRNPEYVVDGLKIIEGAEELMGEAKAEDIKARKDGVGVELEKEATRGSLTLPPIKTEFPFNEGIPSWNGWAAHGAGFRIMMRVGEAGRWSPWFEAGRWGYYGDEVTTRVIRFEGGKYEYDTLLLKKPLNQVQFRVELFRAEKRMLSPILRLLAFSYTNSLEDQEIWERFGDKRPTVSTVINQLRTTETLSIPFRNQVIRRTEWRGQICSPVSVSMAMEYWGVKLPTQEVCERAYDSAARMFGVWPRSIQSAAQSGIRGYVQRFRNWDQVREQVKKGHAICASIRFKREEVKDPPRIYRKRGTGGHLIVIKGFAPEGKVVVHDSASRRYGMDNLWRQDDLARAWFDKGGVGYVFTGRPFRPARQERAGSVPPPPPAP